jgi:hypothetical protein
VLLKKYNLHRVFERPEVLTEVNIRVLVFWDVTRCSGTGVPMLERNLVPPSIWQKNGTLIPPSRWRQQVGTFEQNYTAVQPEECNLEN